MEKQKIIGMSIPELETFMAELGESRYRAQQIMKWVYLKNVDDINRMTDLSKEFRAKLSERALVGDIATIRVSKEDETGTVKYLLRLRDGNTVEAVLMSYHNRLSACLSTQVGCQVKCAFCASGQDGVIRNLAYDEIVEQFIIIARHSQERIGNIVFMGMGEPLLNYDNTVKAMKVLQNPIGVGMRHMTLSTSGILPGMEKITAEGFPITLALSLHSARNEVRNKLVPINKKYPVEAIIEALRNFVKTTGRKVTVEYILIKGLNDSIEDARLLGEIIRGLHCNINLIPYNAVENCEFERPSGNRIRAFQEILEQIGFKVTLRAEKGTSIGAACGQLRATYEKTSSCTGPLLPLSALS